MKTGIGSLGEEFAANYLEKFGFKVLERNFRFRKFGEIDIVAKEKEYICFIEVKARTSNLFGSPSESVNKKKQKRIKDLAMIYLKNKKQFNSNIRFDVVEVFLEYRGYSRNIVVKNINLIRNAF